MRLIVMGQQAFGKDVLEKLLNEGVDEVVAVYCEPDRDGKPADPINQFAPRNSSCLWIIHWEVSSQSAISKCHIFFLG